jgi:hypothetical protein
MTAALTEITYGEQAAVEAEFYTRDEWEGIKLTAKRQEEDDPQVQAAKELVEKSLVLGGELERYLDTKQTAAFNELRNYVGAEGKYVAITKAAKIVYPLEMLKGVRIVDTPGFNDPVVSREQRSIQFLEKADVVILLLYAGRAFDEADRDIIFKKVRNVGVGKIIIAVNKYDVDITKGELEEDLQNSVKDRILKEVRKAQDPILEKLLGKPNPLLFSALMAILAKKPLSDINNNETDRFDYERLCNDVFGIHTQQEMYEKSRLDLLKNEIDNLLKKEKIDILVHKSISGIRAKIDFKRADLDQTLLRLTEELKILDLNPEDLEKNQRECKRQSRKIENAIKEMEIDLKDFVSETIKTSGKNFEKNRTAVIADLKENISTAKSKEEARPRIAFLLSDIQRKLKEEYEELYEIPKVEIVDSEINFRACLPFFKRSS